MSERFIGAGIADTFPSVSVFSARLLTDQSWLIPSANRSLALGKVRPPDGGATSG